METRKRNQQRIRDFALTQRMEREKEKKLKQSTDQTIKDSSKRDPVLVKILTHSDYRPTLDDALQDSELLKYWNEIFASYESINKIVVKDDHTKSIQFK